MRKIISKRAVNKVSGLLVLILGFSGQAHAQTQTTLTPADYIEIQQLVNKLTIALDYCTNGGQDFADLFIPGGKFVIDLGDGKPMVNSTREELVALAWGPDCAARFKAPASYILHLSASLVIEPTAEGARGLSYAIYPAKNGHYLNEETAGQLGIFYDEYIKTPQGWRFKSRRHDTKPVPGQVDLYPKP